MKVLGITGGVGSGKSLALSYLKRKEGLVVYEADMIAKDIQNTDRRCMEAIVNLFGEQILRDDSSLNREKLGAIVFADESLLEQLNAIVHPMVRERIEDLIQEHKAQGIQVFVLETAILLESNYSEICDEIWYIYTGCAERGRRLNESRGYDYTRIHNIQKRQLSEDAFIEGSNRVIDNTKSVEELYLNLEHAMKNFLGEV